MLRERGRLLPRLIFYGIGLICLCVVMYMLGSTMTLWTMHFVQDQTDNVVLEGLSLPSTVSNVIPAMPVTASRETWPSHRKDVTEHNLLRPPNTTA